MYIKEILKIPKYLKCSMHSLNISILCIVILFNLDMTVGIESSKTVNQGENLPIRIPWQYGDGDTVALATKETVGNLRQHSEMTLEHPDAEEFHHLESDISVMESEGLMPVEPQNTMSFEKFKNELRNAESIHDVLRLFYGEVGTLMNNSDIERAFTHKYTARHRGHRRHNTHAQSPPHDPQGMMSDQPSVEGTAEHSYLPDSDSKFQDSVSKFKDYDTNFKDIHIIKASERFIDKHRTSNRKRHKRKGTPKPRAVQSIGSDQDITIAFDHFREMETLTKCADPVPECLDIKSLFTTPNEDYVPKCTRVYKCKKEYGCCGDQARCGPAGSQRVTRKVIVYKHELGGTRSLGVKKITFDNHTACGCQAINQIQSCLPCPKPFVSHRLNTTHCKCDCFYDDAVCISMKSGKRRLYRSSRRCIDSDDCQEPSCKKKRRYDKRTGRCDPIPPTANRAERRHTMEYDQRTSQLIAGSGSDQDLQGRT